MHSLVHVCKRDLILNTRVVHIIPCILLLLSLLLYKAQINNYLIKFFF